MRDKSPGRAISIEKRTRSGSQNLIPKLRAVWLDGTRLASSFFASKRRRKERKEEKEKRMITRNAFDIGV